jgi:hypothetical protein
VTHMCKARERVWSGSGCVQGDVYSTTPTPPAPPTHNATPQTPTSLRTWSFLLRPVCSLPPTAPISSVSLLSLAVWMSSSPGLTTNLPAAHSDATWGQGVDVTDRQVGGCQGSVWSQGPG